MIFDARGHEIAIENYVRYVNTGTVGKVAELKTEDNKDWVLIDKTNLWYNASLVEILDEKDLKAKSDSNDDDTIDVEALKEKQLDLENMELSSQVAEGGG